MDGYMFWRTGFCIGFLLALVLMVLIVAVVVASGLFMQKLSRDLMTEILEDDRYGGGTSDGGED